MKIVRALVDWQNGHTEVAVDTGALHPVTKLPLDPIGVRLDSLAWLEAATPVAALAQATADKIASETAAIAATATAKTATPTLPALP